MQPSILVSPARRDILSRAGGFNRRMYLRLRARLQEPLITAHQLRLLAQEIQQTQLQVLRTHL